MLDDKSVVIVEADGRLGLPEHGPYDAINVGAMAMSVPKKLLKALAPGGRMV